MTKHAQINFIGIADARLASPHLRVQLAVLVVVLLLPSLEVGLEGSVPPEALVGLLLCVGYVASVVLPVAHHSGLNASGSSFLFSGHSLGTPACLPTIVCLMSVMLG